MRNIIPLQLFKNKSSYDFPYIGLYELKLNSSNVLLFQKNFISFFIITQGESITQKDIPSNIRNTFPFI